MLGQFEHQLNTYIHLSLLHAVTPQLVGQVEAAVVSTSALLRQCKLTSTHSRLSGRLNLPDLTAAASPELEAPGHAPQTPPCNNSVVAK